MTPRKITLTAEERTTPEHLTREAQTLLTHLERLGMHQREAIAVMGVAIAALLLSTEEDPIAAAREIGAVIERTITDRLHKHDA